jgi:hypothetical protein
LRRRITARPNPEVLAYAGLLECRAQPLGSTAMGEIASDEVADLAFFALDHAIDSVSAGEPLVPFAVVEDESGRDLTRFAAETLEEGQANAREHVRAARDAVRVAIAYDGYLTVEGERSDAVFVEAQERGRPLGVVLAQRYRPGGRLRKFATIGNPALVEESALIE